jgi:hypothetical protein
MSGRGTVTLSSTTWPWPLDLATYDRAPDLEPRERDALCHLVVGRRAVLWARYPPAPLERLRQPLQDALEMVRASPHLEAELLSTVARAMWERQRTYWGWAPNDWREVVGTSARAFFRQHGMAGRSVLIAIGYLLRCQLDLPRLALETPTTVAAKVFGRAPVDAAIDKVMHIAAGWGYGEKALRTDLPAAIAWVLLVSESPRLEDVRVETIADLAARDLVSRYSRRGFALLARVLAAHGRSGVSPSLVMRENRPLDITANVSREWIDWCQRWYDTTTLEPPTRRQYHRELLLVGRWLGRTHPDVTSPSQWTRELAATYVAAVDRLTVGARSAATVRPHYHAGKPLTPGTKAHYLKILATFLQECQEWGWIARRFDPHRALAPPRAIRAQLGPNPRVLAREIWLKLAWAAQHLVESDLPNEITGYWYPLTLVRALAQTWLWAGLRSDELSRLRVGCCQRATDGSGAHGCDVLSVPPNKTSNAFTKPVNQEVGAAIRAWERVRPDQPAFLDAKTGEVVHYVFAYRGRRVAKGYFTEALIPLLCRKAGIAEADARGRITSHRARATMATELAGQLTTFELRDWLGHKKIESALYYVRVSPTQLIQAYEKAEQASRTLREIPVLLDPQAIQSGAAANGEPWRYYDLGHGYCTYTFWAQCPHRLACVRCPYYQPKDAQRIALLEAQGHLERLRQTVPLSDEEQTIVDGDRRALESLLVRLQDVPTPAGPTPRQLARIGKIELPVVPMPVSQGME